MLTIDGETLSFKFLVRMTQPVIFTFQCTFIMLNKFVGLSSSVFSLTHEALNNSVEVKGYVHCFLAYKIFSILVHSSITRNYWLFRYTKALPRHMLDMLWLMALYRPSHAINKCKHSVEIAVKCKSK